VTSGDLTRYRLMAWVTGVMLLILVFVAMPLKYLGGDDRMVALVGFLHGWLYVAYLVTAFTLAYKLRWPALKTVLVLLAGTVPFMSFVAERRVVQDLRRSQQAEPAPAPPA
jgi:integral membrane protein